MDGPQLVFISEQLIPKVILINAREIEPPLNQLIYLMTLPFPQKYLALRDSVSESVKLKAHYCIKPTGIHQVNL